jgi:hypothetical protein
MATLLSAVTATGASAAAEIAAGFHSYQATGAVTASTGAATINIEVSNTAATNEWIVLGTITLTLGTTTTTDGFSSIAAWKYCRANVTAISGTNAAVTVTVL